MNAKKETAGCSADMLSVWDLAHARIRAHFNIVQTELPYHIHPHFELLYIVKGARMVAGVTVTDYRARSRQKSASE